MEVDLPRNEEFYAELKKRVEKSFSEHSGFALVYGRPYCGRKKFIRRLAKDLRAETYIVTTVGPDIITSPDFERIKGQQVMEEIILSYGRDFNAVYAHSDEMAIGAIQALKAANTGAAYCEVNH